MDSESRRRSRRILFERQGGLCHWCNKIMTLNRRAVSSPEYATFEHLKERARGGKWNFANIVLSHNSCNEARNLAKILKPEAIKRHRLNEKIIRFMPQGSI